MKSRVFRLILCVAALFCVAHGFADAQSHRPLAPQKSEASESLTSLLGIAKSLLANRLPREALARLNSRLGDFAGQPEFDYWLGIAAIEAGQPAVAVFALERVIANDPQNNLARAELGRALFALRELQAAQRELTTVIEGDVPPQAQTGINRYLDAIAQMQRQDEVRFSWGFDASVGYDSNVNAGSRQSEWALADGARLFPDVASQGLAGSTARLGLTLEYQKRLSSKETGFFQVGLSSRLSSVGQNRTLSTLDTVVGVASTRQLSQWTGVLTLGHTQVDAVSLRRVVGVTGQWQTTVGTSNKAGLYGQFFTMQFPNSATQNTHRLLVGATYGKQVANGFSWASAISLTEEKSRTNSPEFSFKGSSFRLAMEWPWYNGLTRLQLQGDSRQYEGVQLLFTGLKRKDREIDVKWSFEKRLNKDWSIEPAIQFNRNHSTIGPNDTERLQIGIGFKRRD